MKDKILSFAGMGIKGRSSSDPLITHLSPTNHPLLQKAWKYTTCMILALLLGVGNMWGAVYKTYGLSDLTNNELTYEVTGLSGNDSKLNKGERKVEVPCASASGTLYFSGTAANADRYASIWGANGTAVDASRKVAMTSGYGSGIDFTSADILTEDGKYYIVFSNVDNADYKINAFKYTLSSACGGGDEPTPSCDGDVAAPTALDVSDITITGATFTVTDAADANNYEFYVSDVNTAPEASATATYTATAKTKAVTDLSASKTYYAWVRAVCDADHKSAWVAAESFTTEAAPVTGTIEDLVTISAEYTYIPTGALADNTLYEGKKIISLGGSGYSNSGIQLKSSRQIAFKVEAGAKIVATFNERSGHDRSLYIGTTSAGTDLASNAYSPLKAVREEAGIVYVSASNDLYLTKLEISYPTFYSVTYDLNGGTVKEGEDAPAESVKEEGDVFTLASADVLNAPTGKEFDKWNDGNADYAAGSSYIVGTANVVLTAKWKDYIVKHTVTYYNGEDALGTEIVDNASNPTATEIVTPHKIGYAFTGWSLTEGGAVKPLNTISVENDMPLYAVYSEIDCAAQSGTIFSLVIDNAPAANCTIRSGTGYETEADLIKYGTVSGGIALAKNASTSNHLIILPANQIQFSGSNGKVHIQFDCALKAGDVIKTTIASQNIAYTTTDSRSTSAYFTKGNAQELTITEGHALENATQIYLWAASSSGGQLTSLEVIRPITYNVTYSEGAGSVKEGKELPKQAATLAGGKFIVASGENLEKSGYDFAGWQWTDDESVTHDVAAGAEFTMPAYDVTFVAQWVVHVAKFTVKYMDGEEVLGNEEVTVGNHPTGIAAPEKDCYTFKAWSTALDEISGSDGETVNVNATWDPIYASSFNFGEATDLTKDNIKSKLNAVGIACGVGTRGGYDDGATTGYLGYKFKDKGDYIAFIVKAGYEAVVTYGFTQSGWTVNGEDAGVATATQAYVDVKYQAVGEDKLFKLVNQSADTKTSALSNIVIREIPAVSDDATLKDLTLKYGEADAETITGFASSTYIYNVVMPYGTTKAELPIVGATATHSGAQVTINQAVDREDWKTVVKVQAEDLLEEHDKYYEVRFAIEPKQGVSIIKATTQKVVTGYIGGTAVLTKNGEAQSGNTTYKLDSKVTFGITLADDETFKAGDVFIMNITTAPGTAEAMGTMKVYDAADATEPIYETDEVGSEGVNYWTLPAAAEGKTSLYIKRGDGKDWNPTFSYVEVRRLMAPVIKSFKIGEAEGVINGTNIAVEVPNATDVTSLTPEIEYYGNGGGAIDKTGAQDFTNVVEYTVSSAYAEDATGAYAPVTYAVTVTKAAAIKEVVISGTLSVKEDETTALSAVVYDTNDAEASNQAVVWSVKSGDESFAEVSAEGVVTGKAVGTAHIIATSVADDTKSAQVKVVISENPCRVWNAPTSSWSDASVTVGKLQIKRGDCPASSSMQPYQGAANNIYGIKVDGSNKFIELTMSDGSQFESLTLGAASNSNGSSPKYVVVASSAKVFAANAVLSAVEYVANAKDAAQALNEIELPLGTRNVRIYRSYDGKGEGTSVFLYFVEACKKELVALEGVTIVNANLAQGRSITPVLALNPTNADVASVTWSFENAEAATAAGLTINAATGEVSATADATEGGYTVKATVTDALSNEKSGTGTITVISAYQQANVTESIVWDWSASCWNGKANTEMTGDDRDADILMANAGPNIVNSNEFRSDMLIVNGQYAWRSEGTGKEYFQGTSIKFTTEVAGIVRVSYRGTGNDKKIRLTINGQDAGSNDQGFAWSNYIEVPVGEVTIIGTGIEGYTGYARIQKIEFVEIGYPRSGLNPANIGTICLPNGGIMKGATLYKMLGKDANHKLNFEDVEGNRLEAGNPYIFVPEAGRTQVNVYYTDNANVSTAGEDHGLVGTFEPLSTIVDGENSPLWGNYIISNNKYILVDSDNCRISANRAYIRNIYDDSKVPYINSNAAPAPGRKRLVIGAGAPQVATGIGDVQGDEVQSSKVLINGQLFILRGEKMYDATGRLVK